jgi:hypothetical protein
MTAILGKSVYFRCIKKFMAIAVILLLSACTGSVPDEIIGTWKTDHPQYANCILQIEKDFITFGDPEGNMNKSSVTGVSRTKEGPMMIVTIDYVDEDKAPFSLDLLFSGENRGSLSLKNQQDITWKRVK